MNSENLFKEKQIEDIKVSDDSKDGVGWKKLSGSSKLRSYRDGKPKDEQLLFREKETSKDSKDKKRAGDRDEKCSERSSKSHSRHRSFHEHDHRHRHHHRHQHRDRNSDEGDKRHSRERKKDESGASKTGSEDTHRRRSKHRQRRKDSELSERSSEKDRKRRHSHHSHKHKKDNEDQERKLSRHRHSHHKSPSPKTRSSNRILHSHSCAKASSLDSKEIYAEGDRIVVSVNFTQKQDENRKDERKLTGSPKQDIKKGNNSAIGSHNSR